MGRVHGFDNSILREESCQERRASESETPDCQARGCKRGEVMYTPYLPNVLLIVKAVDNRPRAEKEHCLEECVCTNVEKC